MFQEKLKEHNHLVSSHGGIHVSIYLKNDKSIALRLKRLIKQSQSIIDNNCEPGDCQPIKIDPKEILLEVTKNYNSFQSVGVFINSNFTKVVPLPWRVEDFSVVSSSFHVKPLLAWLQREYKAYYLWSNNYKIQLYEVSPRENTLVAEFVRDFSKVENSADEIAKLNIETADWLNMEIEPLVLGNRSIYVRDSKDNILLNSIAKEFKRIKKFHFLSDSGDFDFSSNVQRIRQKEREKVREKLRRNYNINLENEMPSHTISSDLNEILKASIENRVSQIFMAYDENIFGKIDYGSKTAKLTYVHKDHEDDDLLDDIAQITMQNGVTPIFLKKEDMEEGQPIIALIKSKT